MKAWEVAKASLATIFIVVAILWALVFGLRAIQIYLGGTEAYSSFADYIVNLQIRGHWPTSGEGSPTYYVARFIIVTVILEGAGLLGLFYLRRMQRTKFRLGEHQSR